jgi:hypothetical protein
MDAWQEVECRADVDLIQSDQESKKEKKPHAYKDGRNSDL